MKILISRHQEHWRFWRVSDLSNHRADSEFEIVAGYRRFRDRIHIVTTARTDTRPIVVGVAVK